MSAPLPDAAAREQIRTALDRTLVVEAAAGTGKTSELIRRIVAVLASGKASVERIVAVTFTEKAAGELKLRLRAGLEEARHQAAVESRGHLEHAIAHLEEAQVNTIHGFCADLLRERPVEAGVDPRFRVMSEAESERLYSEGFDAWLFRNLDQPGEGLRRSLRRKSRFDGEEGPTARLRSAGWMLVGWRDFPAPWRREAFARESTIDDLVERLLAFAELTATCSRPRDRLFRDTEVVRRVAERIRLHEELRPRDHDGIESDLIGLTWEWALRHPPSGGGSGFGPSTTREEVLSALAALLAGVDRFARAANADLAACLRDELWATVEAYEEQKVRTGCLDFVDLLVRARNLLRDVAAVREELQRRFTHVFVDEFQDTDPLQAEILVLLAADDSRVTDWRRVAPVVGKLFLVGDPKQSIYRFRRADVSVYEAVKRQLLRCGADCLQLTASFRAVPAIQSAVNAAFGPAMAADPLHQPEYVGLEAVRPAFVGQPAVVVLPVPEPYGARRISQKAIEPSQADATGAFIAWLLQQSGWTVTERDRPGERVAVAARHVCILFRRFSNFDEDVTGPYVKALEARGVAHLLVGGKSFHAREEVETLRAALGAIEWPDDELAVYATLKGSLFAITDAELFEYRCEHGRLHPFRVPDAARVSAGPIASGLDVLAELHRARSRRTVADSIHALLDATRAHAGFVLRPSGEQVLANVLHIADLARGYEHAGGLSFRGFVERLRDDAARGEAPEAPIVEEGSEGVRLMTVHRAKGLEFPVVILADMTCRLARDTAMRHIDASAGLCALRIGGWAPHELLENEPTELARDRAEAQRVAYVAATRARDLLVVPGIGDAAYEPGWLSAMNVAVHPPPGQHRNATIAAGCPAFGHDSVRTRPAEQGDHFTTVQPGAHRFGAEGAEYEVVWWDPCSLSLNAAPLFGVRQQELLGKDCPDAVRLGDIDAYRAWEAERERATTGGAKCSIRPEAVTRAIRGEGLESNGLGVDDVDSIEVGPPIDHPIGPRFGSLVHSTLAACDLLPAVGPVDAVARLQARMLGASAEEVDAAVRIVMRVLSHPVFVAARLAEQRGRCRREVPVSFLEQSGRLLEGSVDLAYHDGSAWFVVDFKTDRATGVVLQLYRRQVALYAEAVRRATGEPVHAMLLWL